MINIKSFWQDVLSQNKAALPNCFDVDAVIRWHCSNELFSVEEYVRANCEYPGEWGGEIERLEESGDRVISVVRVFPLDKSASFHVVSFFLCRGNKIIEMDEYWADDGAAPTWRQDMSIGKAIR